MKWWDDRDISHHVQGDTETNDANDKRLQFWPRSYNEYPAGFPPQIAKHYVGQWWYIRPLMMANKPCPYEGGFEGTLARGAYALIGVYNGNSHNGNQDYAPVDYDINGNEQPTYPGYHDSILDSGGGPVTASGETKTRYGDCNNCGFLMGVATGYTYEPWQARGHQVRDSSSRVQKQVMTYFRFYLRPGYHKICTKYAWATGVFLRALTESERNQIPSPTPGTASPPSVLHNSAAHGVPRDRPYIWCKQKFAPSVRCVQNGLPRSLTPGSHERDTSPYPCIYTWNIKHVRTSRKRGGE